jgi:hypothetical protein
MLWANSNGITRCFFSHLTKSEYFRAMSCDVLEFQRAAPIMHVAPAACVKLSMALMQRRSETPAHRSGSQIRKSRKLASSVHTLTAPVPWHV